ncbi:CHRD superfamily protein [Colletotrichum tofieldiae]|nr:CHRD superfamily protein [Colletotrichum tofieldiae]
MKATFVPLVLATVAAANPIKIVEEITESIGWHKKGGDDKENKGSWSASGPFSFTSTYDVIATPDQVVDSNNTFTGGLAGAIGYYSYGINSKDNVICYNITLVNFRGDIALPNPAPVEGSQDIRRSIGCLSGPFRTGVNTTGVDSGEGFAVRQIEENPSDFFTDVHSSLAVPGAVRGQLSDGADEEDCPDKK